MATNRIKLGDEQMTGALAEIQPNGKRKISLTKKERQALQKQQLAEAAAALFLDLQEKRRWVDIADELGLSMNQLRDLTKSKEFDIAYNALFAELGHDPRYRAAQARLSDMLPTAIVELGRIMDGSTGATPSIQLRAITKVIELNGLTGQDSRNTGREDLAKFLQDMRVAASPTVVPPDEYAEAMKEVNDVVEGDYKQLEDGEP